MQMQTVVETLRFIRSAGELGLSDAERMAIVDGVANNPSLGDEIRGTGGFRKMRVAGRGKGKSGGYRVITFNSGADIPVFLIDIYSKGEKADLSQAERNALKAVGKAIVAAIRTQDVNPRRTR